MFDPGPRRTRYLIEHFEPKGEGVVLRDRGGWDFWAYLDRGFARTLLQTPLLERNLERFQRSGQRVIERSGVRDMITADPYTFVDLPGQEGVPSCLVRMCSFPGNATQLSIGTDHRGLLDEGSENVWLAYEPKNIDSVQQAAGLLSNWLYWANNIEHALPSANAS